MMGCQSFWVYGTGPEMVPRSLALGWIGGNRSRRPLTLGMAVRRPATTAGSEFGWAAFAKLSEASRCP
jgi:hypothetical protein